MQQNTFRGGHTTALTRVMVVATLAASLFLADGKARAGNASIWTNYTAVAIGNGSAPNAASTIGNISMSSDLTGAAFAANSVTGNTFTLGQDLPSNYPASSYSLTVAGDISAGVNVNEGSVLVGGSVTGTISLNEHGASVVPGSSSSLSTLATTLYNQVTTASSDFNALGNQTTLSANSISSGTITLGYSGGNNGIAAYSISAATLMNGGLQRLDLELGTATGVTVVINVTGLGSGGFSFPNTIGWTGDFTAQYASHIIWNFVGLSGDLVTQNEIYGSILAPGATLENGSAIDGSAWVQSINATGEIHYADGNSIVQYSGFDPVAQSVPEPSSIVLAGLGVMGIGAFVLRRRASL
jgi:choice-of-anchor A domain-containing protein